jgi:LysM repeat protein
MHASFDRRRADGRRGRHLHVGGLALALALAFVPKVAHAAHRAPTESAEAGAETEPTSKWISHKVVPRENLDEIAARYGVTKAALIRWNAKLKKSTYIYAGQKIRVNAKKFPPPREKITYVVQRGDTWNAIAKHFRIDPKDLRYWNKKVPRAFKAGTDLIVYTNPAAHESTTATSVDGGDGDLPEIDVRAGGLAVGKPNRGSLLNGVQLESNDMLKVRDPDKAWGTTHTLENLQTAVAKFRRDTGYSEALLVGAISQKRGGRFRPHSSHQTGRDVDLRMPKRPGADPKSAAVSDIDWDKTWVLITELIETGEVEYIFLDWGRQKALYRAARRAGASSKDIERAIQYPRARKTNNGVVRHAEGHNVHIHIRFKCAPGNSRCDTY